MRKSPQRFTRNKDTARYLQRKTIENCLPAEKFGKLRYFGLPSSALGDVTAWEDIFREFVAVERGEQGKDWELQHDLQLQAFLSELFHKVKLFRGDIDSVIRKGKDSCGNRVRFPFDVVSLDYSGGLFYVDEKGTHCRLQAIAALIEHQGKKKVHFVLLISCNLDSVDHGEVGRILANIKTELVRYGLSGEEVVDAYLHHEREEVRLKLYLPYFVNLEAAKNHYNCETENVIFYEGNKKARMMAFRFCLKYDPSTTSLRPPREKLSQMINKPFIEISGGTAGETSLGLPKLRAPSVGEEKP